MRASACCSGGSWSGEVTSGCCPVSSWRAVTAPGCWGSCGGTSSSKLSSLMSGTGELASKAWTATNWMKDGSRGKRGRKKRCHQYQVSFFFFCTKLCFSFLILGICMHAFGGTLLCFCVASLFFKTINFNKTKHYCEKNKKQATIWDYLLYSSPAWSMRKKQVLQTVL